MTVTINAHQLGRLIDRTINHVGGNSIPQLAGIRLEADATFLYAVASDRYTIAAARYRHQGLDSELFARRTISAGSLPSLREWIAAQPGQTPVTLTVTEDRVRFTTPFSDLGIAAPTSIFIDWRGALRSVIEQLTDEGVPFPALDTHLLARFTAADDIVRVRITANQEAVLIVGEDFLGAQMPARRRRHGIGTDSFTTPDQVHATWQDTLSADTTTAIAMPDAIPAEPSRTRHEVTQDIGETAGDLLEQSILSTHAMRTTDEISTETFAAHATAGVTAWVAYRYLNALHTADPRLAAQIVAETADELDSGEIGEFAWAAATSAGHDPQQWQDAHAKHLADRTAEAPQN
ncbi:hypothetical protein [Streptomyces sp. NBC_00690]|uniref:hypothetical protein n=1 Tax=Streptomyces sp. NBC_00690 TaxID=2975808 RepID=UPI002E2C21E3|nr:hypothetical protein [Streptomyces sp. NBC_00690]